jgi:hypothetical protein
MKFFNNAYKLAPVTAWVMEDTRRIGLISFAAASVAAVVALALGFSPAEVSAIAGHATGNSG